MVICSINRIFGMFHVDIDIPLDYKKNHGYLSSNHKCFRNPPISTFRLSFQ